MYDREVYEKRLGFSNKELMKLKHTNTYSIDEIELQIFNEIKNRRCNRKQEWIYY
jgi:hypothetical protein